MHETFISKIDDCIQDSMSMLSSRNIEYIEKLYKVRHETNKAYDEDYYTHDTEIISEGDNSNILISHLTAYADDKKLNKETSMNHLSCFMEELLKEFESISKLSGDCDKEMALVRRILKEEIYPLFA